MFVGLGLSMFPRPLATLALVALLGCAADTGGASRGEADSLRAVIDTLRREVDALRHGASRLLAEARNALEAERWGEVRRVAGLLAERHPQAPETDSAHALAARADRAEQLVQAAAARQAAAQQRVEEARLARALTGLTRERDDVQNITRYRDATSPRYVNSRSNISLSLAVSDGGEPTLVLHIYYVAEEWLFIERYTVKTGDRTWEIPLDYGDVEQDNNTGGIFEWYNTLADPHLPMIRAIIDAPSATLRYNGRQYRKDRAISAQEKRALQHILDARDALQRARG